MLSRVRAEKAGGTEWLTEVRRKQADASRGLPLVRSVEVHERHLFVLYFFGGVWLPEAVVTVVATREGSCMKRSSNERHATCEFKRAHSR